MLTNSGFSQPLNRLYAFFLINSNSLNNMGTLYLSYVCVATNNKSDGIGFYLTISGTVAL